MTDDAMTTHMFGSAPPAPQETAGEAQFTKHDGPIHMDDLERWDAGCNPTPAAAPTDNTALVEAKAALEDGLWAIGNMASALTALGAEGTITDPSDRMRAAAAALATRPAEATSREGVVETAELRALLARAESFISGFEGDVSQNGVDELLREIRAGAEIARPLDEWHEDMGFVVWWKFPVEEPAWIGSPLCSGWPGYHTHFTPHPCVPAIASPTTPVRK